MINLEYTQLSKSLKIAYMRCHISNNLFYALEGIDNYGVSRAGYSVYD